jgi:xylan 1,4-beta-xylosidase
MRGNDVGASAGPSPTLVQYIRIGASAPFTLEQKVSNKPFYTKLVAATAARTATLKLSHLVPGSYRLQVRRTGYRANDAYSAYLEMGAPASLSETQVQQMHALTRDAAESERVISVRSSGRFSVDVPMHSNDIVLVTLELVP